MTKAVLNRLIRELKEGIQLIYDNRLTGYELFGEISELCDNIGNSDEYKSLTFLEIEKLKTVLNEEMDEKFLMVCKT